MLKDLPSITEKNLSSPISFSNRMKIKYQENPRTLKQTKFNSPQGNVEFKLECYTHLLAIFKSDILYRSCSFQAVLEFRL